MRVIDTLRKKKWASIFVIYLRYLIGGAFVFSAIVKIQGGRFTTDSGASSPIASAWHLFETLYQSGIYWKFLGWGQLIAGLLLMTQRYATLGAVLFFPITLNIFFITISYYFAGTPVITGLILLANLFLLMWDYKRLLPLLQTNPAPIVHDGNKILHKSWWAYTGALLFLITVVYGLIWGRQPNLWFLICLAVGLGSIIIDFLGNIGSDAGKNARKKISTYNPTNEEQSI